MKRLTYDWQPSDWILLGWIMVTGIAIACGIAMAIKATW